MQPGFGSLLMWFIAIVAMIPLALWLLKRSPMGGAMGQRAGTPRTVAVLPLSTQQKVVTVEVGQGEDRLWLVLGVSPQGIRTLHTMAAVGDATDTTPQAPAAAFAQLLTRMRGQGNGSDSNAR